MIKEQKKMVKKTYEEVYKEWGSNCKKITYKNRVMWVTALKRAKDNRVFYIGTFCNLKFNNHSIESIHYNKVITKFERFVDEYCTEWQARASYHYKGYEIMIDQEKDKEFYLGYVQFHKNSTFKHIADTREEVERCCKNRIEKVIYEKDKVKKFSQDFNKITAKLANGARNKKIQELEELQARISTQLEELKKEKNTWIYKDIVLEYGTDEGLDEGYFVGRVKNAPEGTQEFYGRIENVIKSDLEYYIDKLEANYNLYRKLTGKDS